MRSTNLKHIRYLLPLLVLYVLLIFLFSKDVFFADEDRHFNYAQNILQGFYTDAENPSFRNGPGYPMVLSVLMLLKASPLVLKLTNAFFFFCCIIFFFKTLTIFLSHKKALIWSYLLGLYLPILKWLIYMHSEAFALLLISGFLYYFIKLNQSDENEKRNIIFSILFFGFLTLTKVIFSYATITMFIFYLIIFFLKRTKKTKNALVVLGFSFLFCIPYLGHTYALTGKKFLWGTQGGEILYWRSTPFEGEYGDWISSDVVLGKEKGEYHTSDAIRKNHEVFVKSIQGYSFVEQDALYKKKALENINAHPKKYLQNTVASAFRLFFNYPYSYMNQKPTSFFYILPNMFMVVLILTALLLGLTNLNYVSFEIRFIALLAGIFIGGLILLDGRVRHLIPAIPLFLFMIAVIHDKFVAITIKK